MKKRSKLKRYEYQEIYKKYYDDAWKIRQIARYIGRDPSTISRVLRRDIHPCPGVWRRMGTYEKAMYAWEKTIQRRSQSRRRTRLKNERIRNIVVYILKRWHWSPENISGFLDRHRVSISAKAIYNFIKKERQWLSEYLRLRGKQRRQRVVRRRSYFRQGVPERKSIHARPQLTGEGHWEIDTVVSKRGGRGGVLSLRELTTKQSLFFLIPDLQASTVIRVVLPVFQKLPRNMRQTLTSDNGSEFAELYKLEKVLDGFSVYYCDPYKAWQRGSVENTNGELRWFFPKKTDFSLVSEKKLREAEIKINWKPRPSIGGISASKFFKQLLLAQA